MTESLWICVCFQLSRQMQTWTEQKEPGRSWSSSAQSSGARGSRSRSSGVSSWTSSSRRDGNQPPTLSARSESKSRSVGHRPALQPQEQTLRQRRRPPQSSILQRRLGTRGANQISPPQTIKILSAHNPLCLAVQNCCKNIPTSYFTTIVQHWCS